MKLKIEKRLKIPTTKEYSAGFVSNVESETFPPGSNEEIVTRLSQK